MVVVVVTVVMTAMMKTTARYNKAVAKALAADDGVMGWWSGRLVVGVVEGAVGWGPSISASPIPRAHVRSNQMHVNEKKQPCSVPRQLE